MAGERRPKIVCELKAALKKISDNFPQVQLTKLSRVLNSFIRVREGDGRHSEHLSLRKSVFTLRSWRCQTVICTFTCYRLRRSEKFLEFLIYHSLGFWKKVIYFYKFIRQFQDTNVGDRIFMKQRVEAMYLKLLQQVQPKFMYQAEIVREISINQSIIKF